MSVGAISVRFPVPLTMKTNVSSQPGDNGFGVTPLIDWNLINPVMMSLIFFHFIFAQSCQLLYIPTRLDSDYSQHGTWDETELNCVCSLDWKAIACLHKNTLQTNTRRQNKQNPRGMEYITNIDSAKWGSVEQRRQRQQQHIPWHV